MNQRYCLSALAVALGAGLWCLGGTILEPAFPAAPETGLSGTAATPDCQRWAGEGDRTAAELPAPEGFYGAPVGSRLSWSFRHTTSYHLETSPGGDETFTAAGQMSIPFRGVLHMQVLDREEDIITVAVQGTDVAVSVPAGTDEASARAWCDALESWFLVRIDPRGAVSGYAFREDCAPEQRNLVRAMMAGFFHTIPEPPPANWEAKEVDATGEYTAAYRLLSRDAVATEIERVKLGYLSIGTQAAPPEHSLSGRSRARFDTRTGWLARVHIDESMTMDISELPSRVYLDVDAEFEPVSSDWRGIVVDESEWPSFVAASGAAEDLVSGRVVEERGEWRKRTADVSLDQLLAEIQRLIQAGDTRSMEFYNAWLTLSWKLELEPEVVSAAERLILGMALDEETGSMLLSALGKAGSIEAQNALLAVYGSGLEDGWRESAAFSMFQLAEPTAEVLRVISDRIGDLQSIDSLDATSILLFGAIAPRSQSLLRNGRTAMAELLGFEGRARELGATGLWLGALGNAAVPQIAEIAASYLKDKDASIRKDAVRALDRSGAESIAASLIEVAERDPSLEVRVAAIEALGRRGSKSGRETVRRLALGAVDPDVRHAAIQAVAARTPMQARDRDVLAQVARRDRVAELRETARELLAR